MNLGNASAADIINFLYRVDAFRKRDRFEKFNAVCSVLTDKNFESTMDSIISGSEGDQVKNF